MARTHGIGLIRMPRSWKAAVLVVNNLTKKMVGSFFLYQEFTEACFNDMCLPPGVKFSPSAEDFPYG
jgi:hypothetical protein